MEQPTPEPKILVEARRGPFIPNDFGRYWGRRVDKDSVDWYDINILRVGPQAKSYWDAWNRVLAHAVIVEDGCRYKLHRDKDGNIWAIPEGWEWSEEEKQWVPPQK